MNSTAHFGIGIRLMAGISFLALLAAAEREVRAQSADFGVVPQCQADNLVLAEDPPAAPLFGDAGDVVYPPLPEIRDGAAVELIPSSPDPTVTPAILCTAIPTPGPVYPQPGAVDVPLDAVLQWTSGGCSDFVIRLDPGLAATTIICSGSGFACDPPGLLLPGTTYAWSYSATNCVPCAIPYSSPDMTFQTVGTPLPSPSPSASATASHTPSPSPTQTPAVSSTPNPTASPSPPASPSPVPTPDNNDFDSPSNLPSGFGFGTNVGADKEPGEPDHAGDPGGSSVWWTHQYTGTLCRPIDELVILSAMVEGAGTLLAVYTGSSVDNLTHVTSDSAPPGMSAQVSFAALDGVQYHIAVDSTGGQGEVTLERGLSGTPTCLPTPTPPEPTTPTPTPSPTPTSSATATPPVVSPSASPPNPTASPTPVCCQGDANNSGGNVNANDFLAVQAAFGMDNGTGGLGDADCSGGAVNANDFLAVQANFGADCS